MFPFSVKTRNDDGVVCIIWQAQILSVVGNPNDAVPFGYCPTVSIDEGSNLLLAHVKLSNGLIGLMNEPRF